MSSVGVGTGHPDGEDRAMPHGGKLLTGSNLSVNGATNLPGISAFLEVAGYRSLVVQIKNLGATDLTVTPQWDFFDGVAAIGSEEGQIVPAGTSRRLLFQNQGDILNRVRVTGGGAGDTIHYYVTGSNLDPFNTGFRSFLSLIRNPAVQVIPNNTSTFVTYGNVAGTTKYTNDAAAFTFTLDGAGNITQVQLKKAGLYLIRAHATWGAVTGNYQKQLAVSVAETIMLPGITGGQFDVTFDTVAVQNEASFITTVPPGDAAAGTATVDVSVLQVSGGNVDIGDSLLQIVQISPVYP